MTSCKQTTLLVAPIGSLEVIVSTIAANIDKLTIMGERLLHLPRQDALLILCYFLALPQLPYILRIASCFLSTQLKVFDDTLNRKSSLECPPQSGLGCRLHSRYMLEVLVYVEQHSWHPQPF